MARVELNTPAPDFSLEDIQGNTVKLSDYREKSNILLVFNRGFT
jgi:peroxiredoxin